MDPTENDEIASHLKRVYSLLAPLGDKLQECLVEIDKALEQLEEEGHDDE